MTNSAGKLLFGARLSKRESFDSERGAQLECGSGSRLGSVGTVRCGSRVGAIEVDFQRRLRSVQN